MAGNSGRRGIRRVLRTGCVATAPDTSGGIPIPTGPMADNTENLRPATGPPPHEPFPSQATRWHLPGTPGPPRWPSQPEEARPRRRTNSRTGPDADHSLFAAPPDELPPRATLQVALRQVSHAILLAGQRYKRSAFCHARVGLTTSGDASPVPVNLAAGGRQSGHHRPAALRDNDSEVAGGSS